MDKNLLGLIGAGVVAYLFLNKKNESPSELLGCIDPSASNFNNLANTDDGSCTYPMVDNTPPIIVEAPILGCTDPLADNYDLLANIDAENCSYPPVQIFGCMDPTAIDYNPMATIQDSEQECTYAPIQIPAPIIGCMDPYSITFNPLASAAPISGLDINGNPVCQYGDPIDPITFGCTDPTATNYDAMASDDDGNCAYAPVDVYGCVDSVSDNYNPLATIDDGTCSYTPMPIAGCTDSSANNFDSGANYDDGSCTFSGTCYPQGCVSQGVPSPGSSYNNLTSQGCSSLGNYQNAPANCGQVPVVGCTDPLATNFDSMATVGCSTIQDEAPSLPNAPVSLSFSGGEFMIGDY